MAEPLDLKSLRLEAEGGIGIYNPATILALLDEIDRLRQEVEGWKRNADETLASRDLQLSIRKRVETENVTLRSEINRLRQDGYWERPL